MASTLNMAANVATAPQKATFVNAIERAEDDMQRLLARLQSLSGRLCGIQPMSDGPGEEIGDGIFHTVYSTANRISARIQAANDELERIERALP